ncbi:mediator of RNA polymerase II transcription subunit 29-like [Pollicipes pollicipes]|uniref:mediator of RNA polymerase II transcription subunit 29-like n=1 Tax=Pollicipes pollicipes TaxID=41117 RepID=UPI00188542AD|nr:mediator of RNA polymerase II transcription subunit 29-like [Pollicipes pollicipes]
MSSSQQLPQNSQVMAMQQSQAMAQQNPQQAQDPKLDIISQTKLLVTKLKMTLSETMKTAAQAINYNGKIDNGTLKSMDPMAPEFVKNLEKFLSICDLIELNLKTALECSAQMSASQRYTPLPVTGARSDLPSADGLTYNQYIGTVRTQIQAAEEVRNMLQELARQTAPQSADTQS